MSILYNDNEPSINRPIRIDRMNPHKAYERHMGNLFYLQFIIDNSDRFNEKHQAQKEICIAERKIKFWERHRMFDRNQANQILNRIKKDWNK